MSDPSKQQSITEPKEEDTEQEPIKTEVKQEPKRIERKYDPEKIQRRKEKQRQYAKNYRVKMKELAKQGDPKAIAVVNRNLANIEKMKAVNKKNLEEIRKVRLMERENKEKEFQEKKQILEDANKKIEELKNIQVALPEKVIEKVIEKPQLENIVTKDKYKKLKERVNKIETDLQGKKPAFRKDIYDRLFNN